MSDPLSPERLKIAMEVLEELDRRTGHIWMANHEQPLRKHRPHSESDVVVCAKNALSRFVKEAPAGNCQGVAMLTSAFENMLIVASIPLP